MAVAALKGEKTLGELAQEFDVHANQITLWKAQLLEGAAGPADRFEGPSRQDRRAGLLDPYLDWTKGEGIPLHEDFGHDLLALETGRWGRYDAPGCFAHTYGGGDFMANYVLEVEQGKKTRPIKHLYEAVFYILCGHGSTTVWLPDGETRTFECCPRAVFTIPLNCTYQIFNGSGSEAIRLSCTNTAPVSFNLYHNTGFIFDNPYVFPERIGDNRQFE